MIWPDKAVKWTREQIIADAAEAKALFRQRRLGEPLDNYLKAFESLERANRRLLSDFSRLFADPVDPLLVSDIVRDEDLRRRGKRNRSSSFDRFCGFWSEEEARAFDQSLADERRIDEELWNDRD